MHQPHGDASPIAEAGPVDLVALRRATGPVVAWYERLLAGEPMPVAYLETALQGLRALPPVGGRLGRAVTLVATGGREATTEDAVAALEFLRCSAGLRFVQRPAPAPMAGLGTGARRPWTQPPLPGMGSA